MSTLSLLSRGHAQLVKTSQEKLVIHYEPEDYFNWRSRQDFQARRILSGCYGSHGYLEIPPHKTYSTKKGALVLYSEDLALPWHGTHGRKIKKGHKYKRKKFKLELNTLQDLTGAILAYGRKQKTHYSDSYWEPYLHFVSEAEIQNDRQVRPGYSPKRYLARLSQTWDPNTIYKLQQAGSLRDSVQLQQLTTNILESSRRHQDLSSVPLKYQCLPVFASVPLPRWTHNDAFTDLGRCTPVQEETENEEELRYDMDVHEESDCNLDRSMPCTRSLRSQIRRDRFDAQKGELMDIQQREEGITCERNEHGPGSFLKDGIITPHAKPHTTFYGGSFSGSRKYLYGRQDLIKQQYDKEAPLPEGGLLPPIFHSEPMVGRDPTTRVQEAIKLPPISEKTRRDPRRERRRRITEPPKELIIIPLLVRFESQKDSQEGNTKQGKAAKDELQNQGMSEVEQQAPPLTDRVRIPIQERKRRTLQMDIDWNVDPQADADLLPIPEVPPVGSLPPINGKKGPGNQSSMANIKASNAFNSGSSTTQVSKALPTGIIRGSIPEELKECCKGSSVGSLIMSPNGEIVCLSLMGSARDTDIPIRFDFIAEEEEEEEEEDCPPSEYTGQDEQWPCNQQNSEQATGGSKSPSLQPSSDSLEDDTALLFKGKTRSPNLTRPTLQEDDTRFVAAEVCHWWVCMHQSPQQMEVVSVSQVPRISQCCHVTEQQLHKMAAPGLQPSMEKTELRGVGRGNVESDDGDTRSTELAQEAVQDIIGLPSGDRSTPSEKEYQSTEEFSNTEDEEETAQPETTLSESLPSKRKGKITQEEVETNPDTPGTRAVTQREKSHNESEFNELELVTDKITPEEIQDNETAAPSAVQSNHYNKQDEGNIRGPKKQQTTKQKTSERAGKRLPQSIGKSSEIEKVDTVPAGKTRKPPIGPAQMEPDVTKEMSLKDNQAMTEEEEMVLLQDIASSTMKETSKTKGKIKAKSEKAQKPDKGPTTVAKKNKKGRGMQQEKAAFVVGQPKEKRIEGMQSSPTKTSKEVLRQDTIHIEHPEEVDHAVQEEQGEDSDEDSVSESVKNITPTRPDSNDTHSSESEVLPQISSHDEQQSAETPLGTTLEVLALPTQGVEDDYATSETSEVTAGSLQKRRPSRVKELSEKAERRRIEVEKKRREREEQLQLEKEQQERMEQMRDELEQEQKKRVEEARLKKQQQEEEKQRLEEEKNRKKQLEQQTLERARQQQEEHRRKLHEMQRRKQQEEIERIELERQRKKDHERMEAEERLRLLEMAADEREEYKRKKQEREEQTRREEEERRQRAEEEAKAVMEEARRQAQLLAKQTAALEQQLQFNRGLLQESVGMDQTQAISRPWVFSYFELLELLGLPLPVEGE
ncbi:uncharacterized protein KIAA2012 homolog [Pelodytes ibericus]